jgi:hypothetical protein
LNTPLLSKQQAHQRSCINCNELFIPDARNRYHQNYCDKAECRKVSKRTAQQRWLKSDKGAGYFSGEDNKRRVREWRDAHPGYWKRRNESRVEVPVALQDFSNPQDIEIKESPDHCCPNV